MRKKEKNICSSSVDLNHKSTIFKNHFKIMKFPRNKIGATARLGTAAGGKCDHICGRKHAEFDRRICRCEYQF